MRELLRPFAIRLLRQTARGPLVEALPAAHRKPSLPARIQGRVFRFGGRLVGRFLTPAAKARIQEWLINTFRIHVDWQPSAALEGKMAEVLERLGATRDAAVGDYLEFGTYQGNSLLCMHRVTEQLGLGTMRLFGFDSFEGLPPSATEEGVWSPGQFRSEYAFTRELLERGGVDWNRTVLVKGFYDDVLDDDLIAAHDLRRASVIMIDCDLYASTRDALAFCQPLIHDRAAILFDDWLSTDADAGEQRAFREWLSEHPDIEAEALGGYHDKAETFLVRRRM